MEFSFLWGCPICLLDHVVWIVILIVAEPWNLWSYIVIGCKFSWFGSWMQQCDMPLTAIFICLTRYIVFNLIHGEFFCLQVYFIGTSLFAISLLSLFVAIGQLGSGIRFWGRYCFVRGASSFNRVNELQTIG